MKIRKMTFGFDDLLVVPKFSTIESRSLVDLTTNLTPAIQLTAPIVSSNMDTITEHRMALAMERLGGLGIGMGNLIVFELRNNFYLLQTLWIFVNHPRNVSEHWIAPYYLLSVVFFGILAMLGFLKNKLSTKIAIGLFIILLFFAIPYITTGARERSYPKGWTYENDQEVYRIIKENLTTYEDVNVFEFYDATGNVPKYFLKRDNIALDYDDYYHNKYLYVTYPDDTYLKNAAYEVANFTPSKVVRTWKMNDDYNLYLLERL
jgi:hypothetical protein